MASKSACILLFVLAVAVPILAAAARAPNGGWKPIKNPNAPEVVAIAKFAIEEYNKEKKPTAPALTFKSVFAGETQLVEGTNYRLVIETDNGAHAQFPKLYTAVVYSNLKKSLKLVSFKPGF